MRKRKITALILFLSFVSSMATSALKMEISTFPFVNINMQQDDVLRYNGTKLVLFFHHTCDSCHDQIEVLKELTLEYQEQLAIFALEIESQETNETLIAFANQSSLPSSWHLGYAVNTVFEVFNVVLVPHIVILDDVNRLVATISGYATYNYLEKYVRIAINKETENYQTKQLTDVGDALTVLFIILGVCSVFLVLYLLFKNKQKAESLASFYKMALKEKEEEEKKEN
ncbi:MAG: TlpA family protein disulfide reductase [Candidatus Heimdallarchaeaceae archaeon]